MASAQVSPPAREQPDDPAYGGPALGRDDPVWSHYLKHSTQRDTDLVKGWNTSMDLLLLFAALFSAVVTAFLIESQKSLKADSDLITAKGVYRMVVLVEAIASGQRPPPSNSTLSSPDDFHPKRNDIVINTLWFFSLALSLSVALMAMLVKQWGDAYLIGHRFDAHYVQARMRQARYNGLKRWKVKFVVRLLPVMMHISLALFLTGLLLFLKELDIKLFWPVLGALAIILVLYLVSTLAPLFSPFCPYDTPLSSRTLLERVYQGIKIVVPHEEEKFFSREKKEKEKSTSMARDKLTAQAILWLIGHSQGGFSIDDGSQDGMPIEVSIRAIVGTIAGPEFWGYLVKDKLVTLLAQHFTSFFKGTLGSLEGKAVQSEANAFLPLDKPQISLCNQALAKIAKHSDIQLFQDTDPRPSIPERAIAESGRIMLSESYFVSVQHGLLRLLEDTSIDVQASAYCAASAWRTSIGRTNQSGGEPLLKRLVDFIKKNSGKIQQRLLIGLMESLAIEASYIIWEFKEEDLQNTLEAVIDLCLSDPERDLSAEQESHLGQHSHSDPCPPPDLCSLSEQNLFSGKKLPMFNEPVRRATSIGLAVIAALLNDYRRIFDDEVNRLAKSKRGRGKFGICNQYAEAHKAYERRHPYSTDPYLAYSRQWRAVWIAEMCTKNPDYLEANSDALLFLGLSGILRSYQMNLNKFGSVVKLFVDLLELTKEARPSSMALPFILTTSCDVRSQVAEDLIAIFRNRPFESDIETAEKVKSKLLKGISEYGRWIEFRPTLLDEILKLLKSARHLEFQHQCIIALDRYWLTKSSSNFYIYNLPELQLFVESGAIDILIQWFPLATSDNPELRRVLLSCFEKLMRTVELQTNKQGHPNPQAYTNHTQDTQASINQEFSDILAELMNKKGALFMKLVTQILCNIEDPDIQGSWWSYIIKLLREPPTGPSAPTSAPDPVNIPVPPVTREEAREGLRPFVVELESKVNMIL